MFSKKIFCVFLCIFTFGFSKKPQKPLKIPISVWGQIVIGSVGLRSFPTKNDLEENKMTKEITLNKEQCEEIALTIFADIEQYIAEHQAEFEEFLKTEMA